MAKKQAVKAKIQSAKELKVKARIVSKPIKGASKKGGLKRVYFFGNGKAEGDASMRDLLGGKGSGLA